MNIRKVIKSLRPVDALIFCAGIFFSLIIIVFFSRISLAKSILVVNLVILCGIFYLSWLVSSKQNVPRFIKIIFDWYPAVLVYPIFLMVHYISRGIHTTDLDDILISIDRWLFGIDPTIWLSQFAHPILTEILQIGYSSFYFLMVILGLELYIRGEREKFSYAVFIVLYGFILSYIGYLLVPGVGPRFTLHDFHLINQELPGLFLTNTLRDLINIGETIPNETSNAIEHVVRDVFPSGHTQMTLVVIFLATKYRLKTRNFLIICGILLLIGTVYLRYHYVIDLIAGAVFMIFTIWTAPKIFNWWEGKKEKLYS